MLELDNNETKIFNCEECGATFEISVSVRFDKAVRDLKCRFRVEAKCLECQEKGDA